MSGYESTVRFLRSDSIGLVRLCSLASSVLYRAIVRWRSRGATISVVSGRSKVLCSALTWAIEQGIQRSHPFAGMRRPPQPLPRLPLALDDVDLLLRAATKLVADADGARGRQRLLEAEQTELLVRLAADSGARRGELAALKVSDLDGRVLHICRNISGASTVTTPKTHQYRSLTLGSSTVELWNRHLERLPTPGRDRDWLFDPTPGRWTLVIPADWPPASNASATWPACPTHPCTGCVTPSLLCSSPKGELLAAQHRLGHRDLSTTLRHYGWAQAPDDVPVADYIDEILNGHR